MKNGYIKVAAITPKIKVADPHYNTSVILKELESAYAKKAKLIVFPELCLTGYTCNDLFLHNLLLDSAMEQLMVIAEATQGRDAVVAVGLPMQKDGKLYNVAAFLQNGSILGIVPKKNIPTYGEFYEGRHFTAGKDEVEMIALGGQTVPFGSKLLFACENIPELVIGCEICEDLWVACSPGTDHALAGATVLVNLSASNETVGKNEYRKMLVTSTSGRLVCGYIYVSAGEGESTQDLVFGGQNLVAENATLLAQSKRFDTGVLYADVDVQRIVYDRRKMGTFGNYEGPAYTKVLFKLDVEETILERRFDNHPFVPGDPRKREERCEEILNIQALGLKKRYEHTNCKNAVIGISGGLDSTLALLVTVRAFDMLGIDRKGIFAVTMPCFGTTDRTYDNACKLAKMLGTTLEEVDIKEAVTIHLRDIRHDIDNHNITYENAQARERTQVLMDVANRENGMVIGTGDMSELALGWATYNGDHMSMYGVNAGVPKTLVRHLVKFYADTCEDTALAAVLEDVLDTPVSPELLPPKDGEIAQRTEELVGPYELHDFFLYYVLRFGFSPAKSYRIAKIAFAGVYDDAFILKWLTNFYRRFFQNQFKRSCLPDGPKVGSVAVSPRGDLRMPSDASAAIWMEEINTLQ